MLFAMPRGLVRYHQTGNFHFITFSCYHRLPFLTTTTARDLFETSLERIHRRYNFVVAGYVVMPEHVHLLVSEPRIGQLSTVMQALKLSVAVQRSERPFWQARYYDFNVHNPVKRIEKLHYMHQNPVRRGLVAKPEDWPWSSLSASRLTRDAPTLSEAPISRPMNWLECVNAAQTRAEVDAIRQSIDTGMPFGDQAWSAAAPEAIGWRARGRPKRGRTPFSDGSEEKGVRPLFSTVPPVFR